MQDHKSLKRLVFVTTVKGKQSNVAPHEQSGVQCSKVLSAVSMLGVLGNRQAAKRQQTQVCTPCNIGF